jgi:hypothetical protein
MATKPYTRLAADVNHDMPTGVIVYEWVDLDSGDDGVPVIAPHFSDKTVQFIVGTAGDSSVLFEGTLDTDSSPGDWIILKGTDGSTDITGTTAYLRGVLQNVYRIRPRATGTTGVNHIARLLIFTTARR